MNEVKKILFGLIGGALVLLSIFGFLYFEYFGIYHAFDKHRSADGWISVFVPPYAWYMAVENWWHDDYAGVDWSEKEKENARYIHLAFQEQQMATRISNQGKPFSLVPPEESTRMWRHIERAYEYARTVTDSVLDKVHPQMRQHWRIEFEEGLRLRLKNWRTHDVRAEIEGQALLDRFGDWWNENKREIRIPR